jgi:hypothetical protein
MTMHVGDLWHTSLNFNSQIAFQLSCVPKPRLSFGFICAWTNRHSVCVHANKDLGLDLTGYITRFLICICGHNTVTVLLCRQLWVSAHTVIFNFVYTVQAHATEQAETRPMTCTHDTYQGTERTQEKALHIFILLTMMFMY